ncbi:nickel pincer cofactor biosynthesis protein LarB [Treponema sp. HNW]|uniref:nickel pincer cofactor biosynthesis protein LarB n=1 Tax=Treponema sp. HNW TaxID=3116654 RepID=UPI003D0984C1
MAAQDILAILEQVESGKLSARDAHLLLKKKPFDDLGFAKPDHHRAVRQGEAEVIYGEGKTAEQIASIADSLCANGATSLLITRLSEEKAAVLQKTYKMHYDTISRLGIIGTMPEAEGKGNIVVASAGTSDMSVAEEAARTAEFFGNRVVRLYDVGVAGLHRLLSNLDCIMSARVIIAVAGMEGALASVIGGLADCPVIAVPTSVGYGASFNGLAALLAMLNSCASGVGVVNIDNGFGAGYLAGMINRMSQ